MNSRAIAAKIIYQVIFQKQSLDVVIPEYVAQLNASAHASDRAFIQELCYGTLRWHQRLGRLTRVLLHNSSKKCDDLIYTLLLVGLYQLLYLQVPEYAAINETVTAARALKKNWATAFLNGVLRNFLRTKNKVLEEFDQEKNEDLVAKYSHPLWLINALKKVWPDRWGAILDANNERPPMCLRVNLQVCSRDEYLRKFQPDSEILKDAKSVSVAPAAIILDKPCDVLSLPSFLQGTVSVQDLAAQFAPELLELAPGQRVLDACAAPGGKTAHILETEPNLAEVVALDVNTTRMALITENLVRLNMQKKAVVICGDASQTKEWWGGKKFDRILLDAPCSATGVIRRHPDIKILRAEKDIENLAAKQLQLLNALWPLLNEGGLLVYATCSVLPQENFAVIAKFLQAQNDAHEKIIDANWGVAVKYGRQIFPEKDGSDGFYYVKLFKKRGI